MPPPADPRRADVRPRPGRPACACASWCARCTPPGRRSSSRRTSSPMPRRCAIASPSSPADVCARSSTSAPPAPRSYELVVGPLPGATLASLERLAGGAPVAAGGGWRLRLPGSTAVGPALDLVRAAGGTVESLVPVASVARGALPRPRRIRHPSRMNRSATVTRVCPAIPDSAASAKNAKSRFGKIHLDWSNNSSLFTRRWRRGRAALRRTTTSASPTTCAATPTRRWCRCGRRSRYTPTAPRLRSRYGDLRAQGHRGRRSALVCAGGSARLELIRARTSTSARCAISAASTTPPRRRYAPASRRRRTTRACCSVWASRCRGQGGREEAQLVFAWVEHPL